MRGLNGLSAVALAASALLLAACTTPPTATAPAAGAQQASGAGSTQTQPAPGLGDTKAMAIEVCMPPGQRAYLNRLLCADGSKPSYFRVGNFGSRNEVPPKLSDEDQARLMLGKLQPDDPDLHIVDGYQVSCGETKRMVYMDMYHCKQAPPTTVPAGFGKED